MLRRLGLALLLCGCGDDGGSSSGTQEGTGSMTNSSLDGSTGSSSSSTSMAMTFNPPVSTSADTGSTTDLETGSSGTTGVTPCSPMEPPDFADTHRFLWVANRSEGSVSKVDMETATEVGRYYTREDQLGAPAFISVGYNGDVAVAHSAGRGITVIYTDSEDCEDTNGTRGIQTSTDSTPLEFGEEECIAWQADDTDYAFQYPVVYTPGGWNSSRCRYEDDFIWTAGLPPGAGAEIEVFLHEADDGTVVNSVILTGVDGGLGGITSAATDDFGTFWGIIPDGDTSLVRVQTNFTVELFPLPEPAVGIAVARDGRVYTCGAMVGRFDPFDDSWTHMDVAGNPNPFRGCAIDGTLLWMPSGLETELIGIDLETLTVTQSIDGPEILGAIGVEFDGTLWATRFLFMELYQFDGGVDTVGGFTDLFTFGDLTGFQLVNATQ